MGSGSSLCKGSESKQRFAHRKFSGAKNHVLVHGCVSVVTYALSLHLLLIYTFIHQLFADTSSESIYPWAGQCWGHSSECAFTGLSIQGQQTLKK